MYRLKGSHAYQHGVYIRPGEYAELWRELKREAEMLKISLSELVSHTMFLYWNGKPAYSYSRVNKSRKHGKRRRARYQRSS